MGLIFYDFKTYYVSCSCSLDLNHRSVQELTRELQHCRKKLDIYESSSGSNSLGQGSRASSCNSLNTVEGSMVNTSSSKVSAGGQSSPGNSGTSQVMFYSTAF